MIVAGHRFRRTIGSRLRMSLRSNGDCSAQTLCVPKALSELIT
jgi:hypothetical protein